MIHYHGGVLHVGALEHWQYAGRNFCVSYAYPEHIRLYHEIGQSVAIDNGAFSLWKEGKPTDWPAFYEWVKPWLRYQTTWAIIPDVMDGTDEENDALVWEWQEWCQGNNVEPYKGAPVYHMPESLDRLDKLCDEWDLVCLSISSTKYGQINSPRWWDRMNEIMEVACGDWETDEHGNVRGWPRARFHLLRGLAFSAGPFPLWSADSASVARSWAGSPKSGIAMKEVAKFFASFDGRNPPPYWIKPVKQDALFDAGAKDPEFTAEQLEEADLLDPHPDEDKEAVPLQRMESNRRQTELL